MVASRVLPSRTSIRKERKGSSSIKRAQGGKGGDSGVTVGARFDFLRESPLWLRMAVRGAERIRSHAPCFRRNLPRVKRVPRRCDIM